MTPELGQLQSVNLRDVWIGEASDFTPWLAQSDNLKLLGDTLGLELELEAQEKDVGPFRADILCKDTVTNNWALIENQLERTDHNHLGQLLTYAAGLKAVTIVWIADHFTEEHRAAVDWLNEITEEHFNFFGLEIELWRIGDSLVAPKFNVISQPNDWSRAVAAKKTQVEHGSLSETKVIQLEFWRSFRSQAEEQAEHFRATKPHPQQWMDMALGKTGTCLTAVASFADSETGTYDNHEVRAEVVTYGENAKRYFEALKNEKDNIEAVFGNELEWRSSDNTQKCRVYVRKIVDLYDRDRWSEYHHWLIAQLDALHNAFSRRVISLEVGGEQGGADAGMM